MRARRTGRAPSVPPDGYTSGRTALAEPLHRGFGRLHVGQQIRTARRDRAGRAVLDPLAEPFGQVVVLRSWQAGALVRAGKARIRRTLDGIGACRRALAGRLIGAIALQLLGIAALRLDLRVVVLGEVGWAASAGLGWSHHGWSPLGLGPGGPLARPGWAVGSA